MRATITKIDLPRVGTDGVKYRLTCFHLDTGGSAISYICAGMKNFKKWEAVLEVGNVLDNLVMKPGDKSIIDADKSNPTLFFRPPKQEELF